MRGVEGRRHFVRHLACPPKLFCYLSDDCGLEAKAGHSLCRGVPAVNLIIARHLWVCVERWNTVAIC